MTVESELTSAPFFAAAAAAVPRQAGRRRLGEVLVEQGAITEAQLQEALSMQRDVPPGERRQRLGTIIVSAGFASERQLATALGTALGLDVVDLGVRPPAPDVVRMLPRSLAERHQVLAVERKDGGVLVVACADPTNVVALDDVRLYAKAAEVQVVVATESQLRDHIGRAWSLSEDASDVTTMFDDFDEEPEDADSGFTDNAPTVRLVSAIIADAVRAGASDIHIEPQAGDVRIRYRVDGLLREVMSVPRSAAAGLVSRVKVMSNLDIAERRVPQDGRARLSVDGGLVDARVSTLPGVHGEKVVIRLLARADRVSALDELGLDPRQLETLLGALAAPQGLVLITGPTGSGKTNTLYSAIHQIRSVERNIVTLEDPVEIQLGGITQVQVHERAGMTFARGLRSILRQDPDIILVGEVRDPETAKLALEAALTGHLVLTTLHTNNAPAALTRLVEMGVEPFLVASSLSMVVAQRLVRRVCEACAEPYVPSPRTLTLLGLHADDLVGASMRRGKGCGECGGTGYRGRVGIYEMLPVTAQLRSVLLSTPTEAAVVAAARSAGMTTLRGAGVAKARAGITTLEEVLRVTHVDSAGGSRCPTCEHGLAEDMLVCPWCATPVNRGHCQQCARPLDPEWILCPWCRTTAPGAATGSPAAPAPSATPAAPRPRVLVVDDEAAVRSYVAATLEGVAEVDAVADPEEALARLRLGGSAAVLVDQTLPAMSGVDLVARLRGEPAAADVPMAVLTGWPDAALEERAAAAGAADVIAKTSEPAALEERVLALFTRAPAG